MSEILKEPRTFDHRIKQFINTPDMPFIEQACKLLKVKYEPLFREGEEYYRCDNTPIFVPKGKTWIIMHANLAAGQKFDFVFEKAEELKKQNQ